jgi:hypothetical protein
MRMKTLFSLLGILGVLLFGCMVFFALGHANKTLLEISMCIGACAFIVHAQINYNIVLYRKYFRQRQNSAKEADKREEDWISKAQGFMRTHNIYIEVAGNRAATMMFVQYFFWRKAFKRKLSRKISRALNSYDPASPEYAEAERVARIFGYYDE